MIERILEKLPTAKRAGSGYTALCPSHNDQKASLSLTERDGRILMFCHAGCRTEDICVALGLTINQLSNARRKPDRHIVACYQYRDEGGRPLYETVRYSNKHFVQRRPAENDWEWNLNGTRRVLYRLPELLAADKAFPVFICEGEKDVDNLARLGVTATCNPQGALKWRPEYSEFLKGFKCVILPDNDDPGEKHAALVARSLQGIAAEVNILRLPNLPPKGDVSDWIALGNTREDLFALVDGSDVVIKKKRFPEEPTAEPKSKLGAGTHASKLMELAKDVELFHTPDSAAFATISVNSHKETFALRSREFRDWLSFRYWKTEKAMPSSQSIQDVINGMSGKARFEGEERDVHLRVAELNGELFLDLGDPSWRVVKITRDGWEILSSSPIKFRRTKGTLPLPTPERDGTVSELKQFANVADEDWPLLLAWLVAAIRPEKPFPVLVLHGEQGSGKSTTAKVLRLLIDPNKSPLRSSPKDERDLMIAANNSWILSLDNLSSMSVSLSESLCRLSTGGGFSTRELFSDGDEILLNVMRPVILNGIDEVISRSDLLDRSLLLHLPRLTSRFDESSFWAEFDEARPQILGALLDAVSRALADLSDVTSNVRANSVELPRLADFTLWAMAAETSLGMQEGAFFERYKGNRDAAHNLALDYDPLAEAVVELMKHRDIWKGRPSELLVEITKIAGDTVSRSRDFPRNAKAIGRRLSLLAPNLREYGIDYQSPDRNKKDRHLTLQVIDCDRLEGGDEGF